MSKAATVSNNGQSAAKPRSSSFREHLLRAMFTTDMRIDFYDEMSQQMQSSLGIEEALIEIYEAETGKTFQSVGGPTPMTPVAAVTFDCILATRGGKDISAALAHWVSPMELSLIVAGERTGSYLRAFERATFCLEQQAELKQALRKTLTYPAMLVVITIGLFAYLGFSMAPQLLSISALGNWDPDTKDMLSWGLFVQNNAVLLSVGIVGGLVGMFWSFPRLTGKIRDRLDKFAPWSIYRLFNGSVFLLNIAVMLNCGIGLEEALMLLNRHANPYMRERITHTLRGVRGGKNFGDALRLTKHDFPSAKSVRKVQVLSGKKGFDEALERFTKRALKSDKKSIEAAAMLLRIAGLALVGFCLKLIALGLLGISTSSQALGK